MSKRIRQRGAPIEVRRKDGSRRWYLNGVLHRGDDQPAEVRHDGTRRWFQNGVVHRENDKPAVVYGDGTQVWFQHGKPSRDGGKPTQVDPDGSLHWFGYSRAAQNRPEAMYTTGLQRWVSYRNGHRESRGGFVTDCRSTSRRFMFLELLKA